MSLLALRLGALPPTTPELLTKIAALEAVLDSCGTVEIPTEHVLHAGMYARTIAMPEGIVLTGALMKIPTLVTICGKCSVLAGEQWLEFEGYNVIPASAGRKQLFVSWSPVLVTMVFPTQAQTVEEAEAEFTDEADRLLSRRQDVNTVVVTGE